MAKIKLPKSSPSIDMTPMVDLAFLLVTFFMLASQFRSTEAVVVDTPKSVSEIKAPEKGTTMITVDKNGRVFFGMDGDAKMQMLEMMETKYELKLNDKQREAFKGMANFGCKIQELPTVLSMNTNEQKAFFERGTMGIPVMDTTNFELEDWIYSARITNPDSKVCLKGDREANYPAIKRVMEILKKKQINNFSLVTGLEKEDN